MGKDVIVACDFASAAETFRFLDQFTEEKPYVKIGMELYYAEGPQIVREIKARGHRIFLDLKLHDIPNTVKKAMKVLSGLDVDMCNLHAGGTIAMMEAALEGLTRADGSRPLLIAVTQLTRNVWKRTFGSKSHWSRWSITMQPTPKRRDWTAWSAHRWRQRACMRPAAESS